MHGKTWAGVAAQSHVVWCTPKPITAPRIAAQAQMAPLTAVAFDHDAGAFWGGADLEYAAAAVL